MVKRIVLLIGAILLFLGLSQFLLPAAIEEAVAGAVVSLTNTDKVRAKAEKFPALLMLGGQFDEVSVHAERAQAGKVVFDELELRLSDIQVNMPALFRRRALELESAGDIALKGAISESELASAINKTVKGAKDAQVKIAPDKATIKSKFALGGIVSASVALEGRIVAAGDQIVFKTDRFDINNAMLGKFGGAVFTDLVLADLKDLPLHLTVKDVVLEEGRAVIYASNHP